MNYPSIRIEGSILSPDILEKLDDANGQRPADFGLEATVKVKDEIARAWADAQDYWRIYNRKMETLKEDSPATTETRNLWIVPLLGLLGYQLEYEAKSIELNNKLYPISHRVTNRGNAAIHISGGRDPAGLDRKPEKVALKMSAHAMMQEYLNLTEQLYGIVTNGKLIRLLRDSSRLVKLTYLEFDLDRIFSDGLFADFAVLYRLLHVTRLPALLENSADCLLEKYHQETIEQGTRIREGMRIAVTESLQTLGTGFLSHPDNHELRQQIASDEIRPDVYFNHLLRLIYRLLFLMVIEERGMVFPKGTPSKNSTIYFQHYSVQRLRRLSTTRGLQVARHHDAWLQLLATFHLFENTLGSAVLGNTALGGQLFSPANLGPLPACTLSNAALFSAFEKLCYFTHPQNGQRMPVNFGALATEEFGSVYESLLELHPVIDMEPTPYFGFLQAAGNERKTSGSYYTPASLVDCLLNSALDPLLDEAEKSATPEQSMLGLKICDPACGSGHFLIAASQRIARRLARLRAGDEEPSPELLHHTLREVIGHCIFGVDINPMSVELCKVGLWLEAMEPGKPLNFLDHHIKCGNSLLGATPAVVKEGIPDKAYDPIAGDNKEAAKWMKKVNQKDRAGQTRFDFASAEPWERYGNLPAAIAQMEQLDDDTPESLAVKENHYRQIVESSGYDNSRLLHDTWCAAFVWPMSSTDYGTELTTEHLRKIEHNPHSVSPHLKEQIRTLARQYRFFHWHLEFPVVFGIAGDSGFDCIVGNPPWERVKLQEKEYFAERSPEIANAPNAAARKKMIVQLITNNPSLMAEFQAAQRLAEGESHLLRNSGLYPLCGRGDINLYAVFAELGRQRLAPPGYMGLVLPSGIASDDTTKFYFQDIVESSSLVTLFDFENKLGIFADVAPVVKFCVLTTGSGRSVPAGRNAGEAAQFFFFAHSVEDLSDPVRRFTLSVEDIKLLNPNTRTCPIFRSRFDAELTKGIYRRVPVLIRQAQGKNAEENPWGIRFSTLFHMSNDSSLFRTYEQLMDEGGQLAGNVFKLGSSKYLPLYEAKLFHQFNHRPGTFDGVSEENRFKMKAATIYSNSEQLADPEFAILPRFWVEQHEVDDACAGYSDSEWFLAFRGMTNVMTNSRNAIFTVLPKVAVGNSAPVCLLKEKALGFAFVAAANSFVFDYITRQKLAGANLNFFIVEQLPVFPPKTYTQPCPWPDNAKSLRDWLMPRVLELTYTAWDLEPFAKDSGFAGPPFRWEDTRRFQLRCELDAAFFHLYGISRDNVQYIMETFPIVRRKDEAQHGSYRTKDTILDLYDALADAQRTGQPFVSTIDPPPADPRCCHPPKVTDFISPAFVNYSLFPDGTWIRPLVDQSAEIGAILAAVLKAVEGPTPARQVRLTALLSSEPRLLTPTLAGEEAMTWRRLIGAEAEPRPDGVVSFVPRTDSAWGKAVQHLRSSGLLVEDFEAGTWAPGNGLDNIETEGWPEGRVRMVLSILSRRSTEEIVTQLPLDIQRWIYDQAA